jgi:hypothetical protein
MSLETRIEAADTALKERLYTEWRAATAPVREIVFQAPEAEQVALFRSWEKSPEWTGGLTPEDILRICDGHLEPQSGDDELLAALEARIPPDLRARLGAAAEAALAAGLR